MNVLTKISERSKIFEEIVEACQYILDKDSIAKDARLYLDNRLSKDAQKKYQFGYFPQDNSLQQLYSLGIKKEILEKLYLLYPKYVSGTKINHGHFNNHNLIMPFRDSYGNIISLLGRTLLSEEAQNNQNLQKYKYTINAKKDLYVYGLHNARKHIIKKNYVICVEGQFDYIACAEAGIHNCCALGWANMGKYQFFAINRYTNNFLILTDNDDAGKKARVKIKDAYAKYANIKNAYIPNEYKDIDECLRKDPNKNDIIKWLNDTKI